MPSHVVVAAGCHRSSFPTPPNCQQRNAPEQEFVGEAFMLPKEFSFLGGRRMAGWSVGGRVDGEAVQ